MSKIFISHASKDRTYVQDLTELIAMCYTVEAGDIICTSIPGYGLPIPTQNYYDQIYNRIQDSDLVIYVCSPNFKESPDCQYELAWGFKKEIDKKFFLAINKKELRNKVKLYGITTFQTFHISDFVKLREKLDSIFGHAANAAIWADKAAKLRLCHTRVLKNRPFFGLGDFLCRHRVFS